MTLPAQVCMQQWATAMLGSTHHSDWDLISFLK